MASTEQFLQETRDNDIRYGVEPFFMHLTLDDKPKTNLKGQLVQKTHEVVQLRFPGDTRFSPTFPVDSMWYRHSGQVLTYAERFADKYRAFVSGEDQIASGTPLEHLKPYGMTPEVISYCRAMKIYSIEAIIALEGQNLKNLGVRANRLKDMAAQWEADKAKGSQMAQEMAEMREKLASYESQKMPAQEFDGLTPEQVSDLSAMSDDDLKDFIEQTLGARPHHKTGRDKLELMYREAQESAA